MAVMPRTSLHGSDTHTFPGAVLQQVQPVRAVSETTAIPSLAVQAACSHLSTTAELSEGRGLSA